MLSCVGVVKHAIAWAIAWDIGLLTHDVALIHAILLHQLLNTHDRALHLHHGLLMTADRGGHLSHLG